MACPAWPLWPDDRRDVDDAAVPLAHHARGGAPDRVERAGEVGVDHGLPLLVGHARDETVARDAGVVHEDRDLAERGFDLAERGVDRGRIGHVGLHRDGLRAFGLDRGLRLSGAVRIGAVTEADRVTGARASAIAIARPMPRDAPVTNATRSDSGSGDAGCSLTRAPNG